jgi:hypothetical protein
MEIFWFCDSHSPAESRQVMGMSDEEAETNDPLLRRLAILSKIHEALFGVPTSRCKIEN